MGIHMCTSLHLGCMLVEYLVVKNVPGNFHIEAQSANHNFHGENTNVSHTVNHMSFGRPLAEVSVFNTTTTPSESTTLTRSLGHTKED